MVKKLIDNFCIDCKIRLGDLRSKRCSPCFHKWGWATGLLKARDMSGNKNTNWRGGLTDRQYYCIKCNSPISYSGNKTTKLCRECGMKPMTEENRLAVSMRFKGKKPSLETRRRMSLAQMGNKKCLGKIKKDRGIPKPDRQGNKHWNWKGGKTSLHVQIRSLLHYEIWRKSIFIRDKFSCVKCNQLGGYKEAHHIKSMVDIIKEYKIKNVDDAIKCKFLWNINNGITLCRKCHNTERCYVVLKNQKGKEIEL